MATFTSDVYVLQGDTEMRCKVLVVSYEQETDTRTVKTADPGPGGDRQIRLIEAKGGSRRRRKRPLAPSYKLSLPLARESGGWGLL